MERVNELTEPALQIASHRNPIVSKMYPVIRMYQCCLTAGTKPHRLPMFTAIRRRHNPFFAPQPSARNARTWRFTSGHFGQFFKVENIHMNCPLPNPRDPLHGITLESIVNQLVPTAWWSEMGRRIPVRCFQFNPTVKSSLTFLRKTHWARQKVEDWFIAEL